MGCAFLWTLWLYITFPFKRGEENDIRNGSVWKLLRWDTSTLYSLLTLTTLSTLADRSQGCRRTAGAFASGDSTLTWLFLSLPQGLWKCQARKVHKRGCLEDTSFIRDSRPWSNGKDFSRALQLRYWECAPSNMHMLKTPAPGTLIISYKANQHQQDLIAKARQWLGHTSANGCFSSRPFCQIKDPIFSSCKWGPGKPPLLCCVFWLKHSTPGTVRYPHAWEASEAQGMPLHTSLQLTWVLP